MFICNQHHQATLEERKSKFIAHIFPHNQLEALLKSLKKEHPKARHFVVAFRYMNKLEQITEGSSDNFEPKGTAGRPALNVLRGHGLINTGVIIVRYFGGIKLGTGGLVRAYSDAVNLAVKECELSEYKKEENYSFKCKYSNLSKVEHILQQLDITNIEKKFETLHVTIEIQTSKDKITKLKQYLEL